MWKKIIFIAAIWSSVRAAEGQPPIISRAEPRTDVGGLKEKLVTFPIELAEIRREGGKWFLWAGDLRLKDLGPQEADAREVLRLVRYFHLNQWGTVGHPLPIMEYWLSDGRAPQKMRAAFFPFDAESLKVEDAPEQYLLRDAKRTLFAFGSREDADQALAVIRKYGFTEIGYVGGGVPVMIIFVAGPDKNSVIRLPGPRPVIGSPGKPAGNDASQKALAVAAQLNPRQLNDASSHLLPQIADETVFFDWRQATVQFEHGEWKVIAGSLPLANCGPLEQDAQDVLRMIQHYRLTERCSIGKPTPAFTFFMTNGQPVRTLLFGVETISCHSEYLTVAQTGSNWSIVDGGRRLLDCGPRERDVRQVLQILQNYKIDHLILAGGSHKPVPIIVLARTR
jgi:hypothetical protein